MVYLYLSYKLFIAIILVTSIGHAEDAQPVYVYRDPVAWGAIYKYCIACHSAEPIDNVDFSATEWGSQIDKCVLKARSSGYPIPTGREREALNDFLPQVTPKDRQPPVYMVRPKRGSFAY